MSNLSKSKSKVSFVGEKLERSQYCRQVYSEYHSGIEKGLLLVATRIQ